MPAVTVLMPAYNGDRYIAEAVDSVLAQTFDDFELIVVDDGSTDGTPQVLARYTDKRLNIIRQNNTGISGALNAGLAAAQGDLIARMDADDIAYPQRLARQVEHMQAHPNCVLLGTGVHMLCPAGLELYEKKVPAQHDQIARALWSGDSQAIIHPAAMMRRDAVRQIGGYRGEYTTVEDLDLYLRLLSHGRAANMPEPLLGYRQHPASTNALHYHKQVRLMRQLVTELESDCPFQGLHRPLLDGWAVLPPNDFYRRCGWNALKKRQPQLARHYAAMAMRCAPLSRDNWRLALCAVRGH